MRLIVGPVGRLAAQPDFWRDADLLVLASPGADLPTLPAAGRRLDLRFNDIAAPREGLVLADAGMVADLLAFAAEASALAIGCYAGISRSTAAAYAVACQAMGPGREWELAEALRGLSPAATPNPRVIALADSALGREGRMVAAVAAIGRGAEAFEGPLFAWRPDDDPGGD